MFCNVSVHLSVFVCMLFNPTSHQQQTEVIVGVYLTYIEWKEVRSGAWLWVETWNDYSLRLRMDEWQLNSITSRRPIDVWGLPDYTPLPSMHGERAPANAWWVVHRTTRITRDVTPVMFRSIDICMSIMFDTQWNTRCTIRPRQANLFEYFFILLHAIPSLNAIV